MYWRPGSGNARCRPYMPNSGMYAPPAGQKVNKLKQPLVVGRASFRPFDAHAVHVHKGAFATRPAVFTQDGDLYRVLTCGRKSF